MNVSVLHDVLVENKFSKDMERILLKQFANTFTQLYGNVYTPLIIQMHTERNSWITGSTFKFYLYLLKEKIRKFKTFCKRTLRIV